MSDPHDIRRHLLKARKELEEANEHLEAMPAPEHIEAAAAEALRRVAYAEAKAAIWCES